MTSSENEVTSEVALTNWRSHEVTLINSLTVTAVSPASLGSGGICPLKGTPVATSSVSAEGSVNPRVCDEAPSSSLVSSLQRLSADIAGDRP